MNLSAIGNNNRKKAALLKLQKASPLNPNFLSGVGVIKFGKTHNRITPDLEHINVGGQSLIGSHFFVLRFRGSMIGFYLDSNTLKNCLEET